MLDRDSIELIPMIELAPSVFATKVRQLPSGSSRDLPGEWFRYWTDSLTDSGIVGLQPVRRGSWQVPTANFDPDNLRRVLSKLFLKWGDGEELSDLDEVPVSSGGFALRCLVRGALIEPGCCADLGGIGEWRKAAGHRGAEWRMLWNGHPWLMVRYEAPLLIVSNEDQLEEPASHIAVSPAALELAMGEASGELERFAAQLARVIPALGCRVDPVALSRKLAGLGEQAV